MRKLLLCMVLVLMAVSASAVPAKPGQVRTLTLKDGSTVVARLVGDEFGHYWLADDGRAFIDDGDRDVYVAVDLKELTAKANERRSRANAHRAQRLQARKVGDIGSYTGTKKGIIILVNFQDKSFQSSQCQELFNKIANLEGFNEGDFKGSMHDYFYDQSLGQFDLTFDVVGPVKVSQNFAYYGRNTGQPGDDQYPATMVIEACQLANSEFDVDFSKYDWDGDTYVDQVYVVYAGMGEADGGAANTIWPHEFSLSGAQYYYGDGTGPLSLDGVTIDTYACGSELNGSEKTCGIGTMCHEFSHCLGYPDFYDTSGGSGVGMFRWDLMDYGSYNDDGYQPAGYTSYERWMAGWTEPTVLSASQEVRNMKPLQENAECYIIYNDANQNEYFLLENRRQIGWDTSLPGSGLLIVHVDYDATAWSYNNVNTVRNHQRMTWVPADNNFNMNYGDDGIPMGEASDLYPYKTNDKFNKLSTPAAKFFNKTSDGTYYMNSSVENITRNSDGTISFNFKGLSNVATPTFSPESGVFTEALNVTISCTTDGASIYYTTDGSTPSSTSSPYTGSILVESTTTISAIAIKDGEESAVATATYVIRDGSQGNATTFKRVTSVSEMVSGLRYVIVCGSKEKAAGAMNGTRLDPVDVTVTDDIVTIADGVAVYTLIGSNGKFSFMAEDGKYLYATAAKSLAYGDEAKDWTVSNDESGVIMTYGNYGTMLYNVGSPRFTTYTSSPNTNMIYANLYMEMEEQQGEDPVGSGRYQLVTSTDDLEAGKNYLVVTSYENNFYAYDGYDSNKGLVGSVVPDASNIIDLTVGTNNAVPVVLANPSGSQWTLYDTDAEAYVGTKEATSGNTRAHLITNTSASTDYFKWTIEIDDESHVASVKNYGKAFYLKYNHNNGSGLFRVYASGMTDIYLYKEIEETETIDVEIGSTHYATLFYGEKNLIVPDGVEAYTYTVSDGKLQQSWLYEADEVIPAGTGVVLKGEPAPSTFTVTTTEGDDDPDNLLLGFDEDATTTAGTGNSDSNFFFYKLNTKNGTNVGFYWGAEEGGTFVSKAHKAYLAVDKETANQIQAFLFDDAVNSIGSIESVVSPSAVYDLQGRRYVSTMGLAKGIYVVNGRKMVIR